MRILVTGANGYIGQGVVRQLLDDGNSVVATDLAVDNIDKRAETFETDIFHLENPYIYFGHPDAILHLAWRNGFVHNHPSHLYDLPYHYSFLNMLAESGIKQISVMGSMHEIGFFEGSIKEDTPTNPLSLYGIGKDALRKSTQLLAAHKKIVFQWIRGYYIVGNLDSGCSIFSKIAKAESDGNKFFPFTSGENQWDFLDYDIFCLQTASVVEQTDITGIINVCSGRPEKLADRVERFIKENNFHIKLEYGAYPDREYDSKAVWGEDRKIKSIMFLRNSKALD